MSWVAALENFAAQADDRSNTAYRRLVACLWDQGHLDADAPAAVPALIRVLMELTTPAGKRARIALLLGLLAEGRDDSSSMLARTVVRLGIPQYLKALGDSSTPAVRLAMIYLLAHFHEDGASILAHESLQGIAGTPAMASLERVLRFQDASRGNLGDYAKQFVPDESAHPDGARSQIRASFLAPLGAEAHFAIENS